MLWWAEDICMQCVCVFVCVGLFWLLHYTLTRYTAVGGSGEWQSYTWDMCCFLPGISLNSSCRLHTHTHNIKIHTNILHVSKGIHTWQNSMVQLEIQDMSTDSDVEFKKKQETWHKTTPGYTCNPVHWERNASLHHGWQFGFSRYGTVLSFPPR